MDRPEERLALIECFERDGRPGRTVDVRAWPLTLGRALANHMVLDDAYVAPRHASIGPDAQGRLVLTVLDTANGVAVDGRRHGAGSTCVLPEAGATLQLGQTRLRLRLPGETLAAEKPLPAAAAVATPWLLGLALLALALAELGLGLDPGADLTAWLPVVMGLPVAVAGWCGLWALLSKVFQHRFDFAGHLRIALPWMLAVQLADALLPQVAASLGWPWLWRLAAPAQVLLFALWLREHMAHVLPAYRRTVTAAVAAATLAGSAISLSFIHRATDSVSRAPYMSTLPLPATRLAGTVPTSVLVQDMAGLADPLAARARKAREEDEDDGAEEQE
ncbi:MAG: FHA domain-containing protein [Rubrivivax sp.]|nr:FHA domain-containing protein [Rubrivivax sp.]